MPTIFPCLSRRRRRRRRPFAAGWLAGFACVCVGSVYKWKYMAARTPCPIRAGSREHDQNTRHVLYGCNFVKSLTKKSRSVCHILGNFGESYQWDRQGRQDLHHHRTFTAFFCAHNHYLNTATQCVRTTDGPTDRPAHRTAFGQTCVAPACKQILCRRRRHDQSPSHSTPAGVRAHMPNSNGPAKRSLGLLSHTDRFWCSAKCFSTMRQFSHRRGRCCRRRRRRRCRVCVCWCVDVCVHPSQIILVTSVRGWDCGWSEWRRGRWCGENLVYSMYLSAYVVARLSRKHARTPRDDICNN